MPDALKELEAAKTLLAEVCGMLSGLGQSFRAFGHEATASEVLKMAGRCATAAGVKVPGFGSEYGGIDGHA